MPEEKSGNAYTSRLPLILPRTDNPYRIESQNRRLIRHGHNSPVADDGLHLSAELDDILRLANRAIF